MIRCESNPIITKADVAPSTPQMEVLGVFNCGVAKYHNQTILLLRVAEKAIDVNGFVRVPIFDVQTNREVILDFDTNDRSIDFSDVRFVKTKDQLFLTSKSHLRLARSTDGIHFLIDDKPFLSSQFFYEEYGIEDPRITFVDDWYYIDYSATSRHGVFTCLARTKDFVSVEKLGIIFLPDNKDVSIFPQKINGKYYALNRPVSAYFQRPEMWISTSADLRSFSEHHLLCEPRPDKFDSTRIGAGCVPVLTSKGWLEIYHGCDKNDKYCMGALLLDANDPTKIIARSDEPLLQPEMPYELNGFMPSVVFGCGLLQEGDELKLYYGACDESICLASFSLEEILHSLTYINNI